MPALLADSYRVRCELLEMLELDAYLCYSVSVGAGVCCRLYVVGCALQVRLCVVGCVLQVASV
jgi:hypothetical protein